MNKEVKIIDFHPEHLNLMDIREHEIENVLSIKYSRERIKVLTDTGTSGTIIYDGKILGVMGIFDMWKGVCEVWVLPSNNILQHKLVFARTIKKYLKSILNLNFYNRVQVTALDDDLHNRFFHWLGFKLETPFGMPNFSFDGSTYNMWSIINGGSSRI